MLDVGGECVIIQYFFYPYLHWLVLFTIFRLSWVSKITIKHCIVVIHRKYLMGLAFYPKEACIRSFPAVDPCCCDDVFEEWIRVMRRPMLFLRWAWTESMLNPTKTAAPKCTLRYEWGYGGWWVESPIISQVFQTQ